MQRRGRGKKSRLQLEVASDRIRTLYDLAVSRARSGDLILARRYTLLARKIGMRYTVRIPAHLKMITCRSCFVPMIPDVTSRTRIRNGRIITTCLECGRIMRHPIKPGGNEEEGLYEEHK
ncbi:MAG: ribonuclease P protein component 4 [Thermoplasmatota archaeon]